MFHARSRADSQEQTRRVDFKIPIEFKTDIPSFSFPLSRPSELLTAWIATFYRRSQHSFLSFSLSLSRGKVVLSDYRIRIRINSIRRSSGVLYPPSLDNGLNRSVDRGNPSPSISYKIQNDTKREDEGESLLWEPWGWKGEGGLSRDWKGEGDTSTFLNSIRLLLFLSARSLGDFLVIHSGLGNKRSRQSRHGFSKISASYRQN